MAYRNSDSYDVHADGRTDRNHCNADNSADGIRKHGNDVVDLVHADHDICQNQHDTMFNNYDHDHDNDGDDDHVWSCSDPDSSDSRVYNGNIHRLVINKPGCKHHAVRNDDGGIGSSIRNEPACICS